MRLRRVVLPLLFFGLIAVSSKTSAGTITSVNLLLPAVQKVRDAAARFETGRTLREILLLPHSRYLQSMQGTVSTTAWGSSSFSSIHLLPSIDQSELYSSLDVRQESAQRIAIEHRIFAGASLTSDPLQNTYDDYLLLPFRVRRLAGNAPFPTVLIGQRASAVLTVGDGPIELSRHTKLFTLEGGSSDGTLAGEWYGSVIADQNSAFGVGNWGGPLTQSDGTWVLSERPQINYQEDNSDGAWRALAVQMSLNMNSSDQVDALNTFNTTIWIDDPNFELIMPTTGAVPEPSSVLLFCLATGGLLCVRHPRRKRRATRLLTTCR